MVIMMIMMIMLIKEKKKERRWYTVFCEKRIKFRLLKIIQNFKENMIKIIFKQIIKI